MKSGSRSNALLVELLIVIAFFMIAGTTLLEVFTKAWEQGGHAGIVTHAINEAQNVAEHLYAAHDGQSELEALGFSLDGTMWVRDDGSYLLEAQSETQMRTGGVWRKQEVRVTLEDETILTLPCSKYEEGEP